MYLVHPLKNYQGRAGREKNADNALKHAPGTVKYTR